MRETVPEREAAAARKALERSHNASEALVTSLRGELQRVKEGAPTPPATDDAAVATLRSENAELRRQLAERPAAANVAPAAGTTTLASLEARLAFYEMMTGMRVELADGVATCTVTAASRSATFELHLDPAKTRPSDEEYEQGDLEYVPLEASPEVELPVYLQEAITFEREQAPTFLQKVRSCVAVDDED